MTVLSKEPDTFYIYVNIEKAKIMAYEKLKFNENDILQMSSNPHDPTLGAIIYPDTIFLKKYYDGAFRTSTIKPKKVSSLIQLIWLLTGRS